MLQRIQSIYLALIILIGLAIISFPFYTFFSPDGDYIFSLINTSFTNAVRMDTLAINYLLICTHCLFLIITTITIFKFNKRMVQVQLINIVIVLILILSGFIAYQYNELKILAKLHTSVYFSPVLLFIPLTLILLLLAKAAIKKDEALVRSANRLR